MDSRIGTLAKAACALLAAFNLLVGLGGGLARFGLPVPGAAVQAHGAVMVCGFFGTLIALERAVALQRLSGLVAPLAAAAGGLAAWIAPSGGAAIAAWIGAAAALVGLYLLAGFTRAWSLHLAVELAAAVCWGAGTLAWGQRQHDAALLGWMAFLVLTVAAERRELTQMVRLGALARIAFLGAVATALAAVLSGCLAAAGVWGAGPLPALLWWIACAALAAWLARWDLAPRQWRRPGWAGHTAVCLTVGYGWLLAAAVLGLAALRQGGGVGAGALHAVLLGFVFAMVFGHAPIVLPALARTRPVYSGWLRAPIWLLAASLVLRLAGAEAGSARALAWAGIGHAAAIGLFAVLMARAAWRGRR